MPRGRRRNEDWGTRCTQRAAPPHTHGMGQKLTALRRSRRLPCGAQVGPLPYAGAFWEVKTQTSRTLKTPSNTSNTTSTWSPCRYDVPETVSHISRASKRPRIPLEAACANCTHDQELMRLTLLRSTHLVSLALCAQAFSPSSAAPLGLRLRGAGLSG